LRGQAEYKTPQCTKPRFHKKSIRGAVHQEKKVEGKDYPTTDEECNFDIDSPGF
jgi:hypothetical protein